MRCWYRMRLFIPTNPRFFTCIFSQNIYFCYNSQFTFNRCNGHLPNSPCSLWQLNTLKRSLTLWFWYMKRPSMPNGSYFSMLNRFESTRIEFQISPFENERKRLWFNTEFLWTRRPFIRSLQNVYTDWMWMFSIIILYAVATIFDFIQTTAYLVHWTTALFLLPSTLAHAFSWRGNSARFHNASTERRRTLKRSVCVTNTHECGWRFWCYTFRRFQHGNRSMLTVNRDNVGEK